MYENLGAAVDGDGRVTFSLFLPNNRVDPAQYTRGSDPQIRAIRVRGAGKRYQKQQKSVLICEIRVQQKIKLPRPKESSRWLWA